ncbi:MBL fold metallo-hydrolase [Chryseobacterium sp. NFX27]|uniref:MBL fold metallo-hydrolase n=1 Tax=Chryseobacterium sp. NFX27 TaxID=2819618 RepID=UPI003CEF2751
MKIEQIYTGCLAQGAYYIVSNGEAAIIDPLREVKPYLDRLEKDNVKLKFIFETHFHADFVSGHVDLSKKTDAAIVYGPTAAPEFSAVIAEDRQVFEIGDIKIKVLHTPGHTLESSCFLLIDETGGEKALFSGDTLFLGDVGRPDLAQKGTMSQEELAGLLYESLYKKILPLPDDIVIYPAHGAGSACGKNMQKETVDSLGNQRKTNYALNQEDKDGFIKAVTDGLLPPPGYFGMNVALNRKGSQSFDDVIAKGMQALSSEEFEEAAEISNALLIDVRPHQEFAAGFIPKSINIGLAGDFAPWVGTLVADVEQPILLITNENEQEETLTRLSRVGFDHVLGYLKGGFTAWKDSNKEIDTVNRISAEQFESRIKNNPAPIFDVRKESEYHTEHVHEAFNKPLAYINEWAGSLTGTEHFYLHCAGGYRSMMTASILQARGFRNFTEIDGGYTAIAKTGVPTTDFICQSKIFNK